MDDEAFSVLSLLVSELVTNSVKHSTGPPDAAVELCVDSSRARIRVEVTDRGDVFDPVELGDPDPDLAPSGRGLFLVDRLSSAWGVRDGEPNTTVWFELDGITTTKLP
ncbi:MAG: ATP-binding protein [Actinomycetota bacterium]|nr:ATP-binding protein [Actinomycetota bacterium]